MPIVISDSNQAKIPVKLAAEGNVSPPDTHNHQTAYNPFIDKISIVLKLPAENAQQIYLTVEDAIKIKSIFGWARRSPDFKWVTLIACEGTTERVHFQFGSKQPNAPDCRLEFNPRKMSDAGMTGLDQVLLGMFPDGWCFVLAHGYVSRIDVAVDITGVRMDDFLCLETHGVSNGWYSRNGHLETLYFGKRKGNQIRVYDKAKEQKCKGISMNQHIVRVECTVRNSKIGLQSLSKLHNPFAHLSMIEKLPSAPPSECVKRWCRFQDSANSRGLGAALALLPEKRRAMYRKHLIASPQPWWNPEAIWANWPKAIEILK